MESKKYKDLGLMTLEMMKSECRAYFNQYGKLISMPSSVLIRLQLVMKEISRKEGIDFEEKKKSENAKALEAQKANNKLEMDEMFKLQTEFAGLNIKHLRRIYNEETSSGSKDIDLKKK